MYSAPCQNLITEPIRVVLFFFHETHTSTPYSATHLPVCTEGKDTISVLKLPCNATTTEYCYWTPAITDADSTGANTLQVDIPCGLKDHTVLVVIGTVSMTVLGTLYLAYAATTVAIR